MQVQHDARAGGARRGERAPAEGRVEVVRVTTRAPVRRTAAATSSGASPPRSSADGRPRAPQRGAVALQQLGFLAELLAHQPQRGPRPRAPRRR